jgi:hypothetical protein
MRPAKILLAKLSYNMLGDDMEINQDVESRFRESDFCRWLRVTLDSGIDRIDIPQRAGFALRKSVA